MMNPPSTGDLYTRKASEANHDRSSKAQALIDRKATLEPSEAETAECKDAWRLK